LEGGCTVVDIAGVFLWGDVGSKNSFWGSIPFWGDGIAIVLLYVFLGGMQLVDGCLEGWDVLRRDRSFTFAGEIIFV
jgi:hypothetical protein